MFADVILHRRVPSQFPSFTYAVPENLALAPGQIVEVTFRTQRIPALVRRLHAIAPSYPTKTISAASTLILDPHQFELASWMADFYHAPFSNVIDFFIPENVWKGKQGEILRQAQNDKEDDKQNGTQKPSIEINSLAKKLLNTPTKKILLEKTPIARRTLHKALQQALPEEAQLLLLFPEVFAAGQFADESAAQFHSELTEKQKAATWHGVRAGEVKKIVGTRAALFLPFKKLGAIVLDFEHSESYKEKRVPAYHALSVAEKLSELWEIPLIIISATPRAETWGKFETHEFCEEKNKSGVIIIDMSDERRRENFGIFADRVIEGVAGALAQNQQILLFINRKGEASAMICSDCGGVFRCAKCASPLTLHTNKLLKCHHCKMEKEVPASCPTCGNTKLKSLGIGTERLEREVKKIFGKANVLRLEKETHKLLLDEKTLEKADIIIATQIIEKPISLPRLKLAVAVSPDTLLNVPHFRASERVFQILTHLKLLMHKGTLIIQTFLPENRVLKNLSADDVSQFYKNELATRKSLNLPPFQNQTCTSAPSS